MSAVSASVFFYFFFQLNLVTVFTYYDTSARTRPHFIDVDFFRRTRIGWLVQLSTQQFMKFMSIKNSELRASAQPVPMLQDVYDYSLFSKTEKLLLQNNYCMVGCRQYGTYSVYTLGTMQ